jgi:TolA-binding protein
MCHLFSLCVVKISFASVMLAMATTAVAATSILVPVEDFSAVTPGVWAQAQAKKQIQQQNANAELFVLLDSLQQEVAQLRGQVEELNFKLRQMEQNQKDRYIDLDRRIIDLNTQAVQIGAGSVPLQPIVATNIAVVAPESAVVVKTEPDSPQQQSDYKAAFNLIRAKKFEQAIAALLTFVNNYPNGALTGNAH